MYYWVCPYKAQISHIYMWLVVSRESYGECLRHFCVDGTIDLLLKEEMNKNDIEDMGIKTIILVLVLVTLPLAECLADGVKFLIVNSKDGTQTSFALADEPKVSFSNGELCIVSSTRTYSISLADVQNYTLLEESTRINELIKDGSVNLEKGSIIYSGLTTGSRIAVYTQDGKLVKEIKTEADGSAIVELLGLPKGILILQSNGTNVKIINR